MLTGGELNWLTWLGYCCLKRIMKTGQIWPYRKDRDDCNDRVSLKSPQNANNTSFPNNQTLEHLITKTWWSLLQVGQPQPPNSADGSKLARDE